MCTVHYTGSPQHAPSIGRLWLCLDPTHPIIHYSLRPKIFFGLGFPYPLFGCCPPAPLLQGVFVFVFIFVSLSSIWARSMRKMRSYLCTSRGRGKFKMVQKILQNPWLCSRVLLAFSGFKITFFRFLQLQTSRSQGSSLICLISWCEYVATLVTALLPSFSMFCCDPLNRFGRPPYVKCNPNILKKMF